MIIGMSVFMIVFFRIGAQHNYYILETTQNHTTRHFIAGLIRGHRIKKDITQQELAYALNADRQYIWKIERGRVNLTMDYLGKILVSLECTPEEFFDSK